MGHERIGFLPKTKQWQAIITELENYDGNPNDVVDIANATLECIRDLYKRIAYDESMIKGIRFLLTLCFSAKSSTQAQYLNSQGFDTDSSITLFSLLNSANKYITTDQGSLEINKMVRDAVMQSVITYERQHKTEQLLFEEFGQDNPWQKAGTGAAFCELARSFVASFTERQLRYYLDRVAAGTIKDYEQFSSFSQKLSEHTEAITGHASDISKLMQSFSAGWYNKYSTKSIPPDTDISRFLSMTFGKLREEFRREGLSE